jgi:hypothetical protein
MMARRSSLLFVGVVILFSPASLVFADGKLIDSNSGIRGDFRQLARRLSMDLRIELKEIDAKFLAQKIRQYAALGEVSASSDPVLRRIADDTTRMYASLESIHIILEPKELELGPVLVSLMTKMLADARIAEDNRKLLAFKSQIWPKLLPYARRFAGPKVDENLLDEVVLTNAIGASWAGGGLQTIRLKNGSRKTLTNCTLVVDVTDLWGNMQTVYYFIPEMRADDSFDSNPIRSNGTLATVNYSLYADQVSAENRTFEFAGNKIVELRDKYLKVFSAQQRFDGRWDNSQAQIRRGQIALKIGSVSSANALFVGPQIDARIVDPADQTQRPTPLTGTLRAVADPGTGKINDLELVFVGASRTFTFRIDGDSIVGEDTQKNKYRIRARKK